jgi:hypothetical protein
MTAPAYIQTGKENVLYSLYTALQNQFSGWTGNLSSTSFTISPMSWNQNLTFPCLTIQDVGGPSLGNMAMGRQLQEGFYGLEEKSQFEMNIYDQNTEGGVGEIVYTSAERNVRRLRDLVQDYFINAAFLGGNGSQIYRAITLLDAVAGTSTQSQVWYDQEKPGTWTETFIENTPDMINVKRYRIYAQFHWYRYTSTPSGND